MITAIATPLREKVTFASLADMAGTMRDEAIVTARRTLAEPQRKADLATLLRTPSFLGNFKYGLVSGVAALVMNDPRVRRSTPDPASR
jgi:hypothetical protein